MNIKKLSLKTIVLLFMLMHLLPVGVFAQSQEDINPEFDLSSSEDLKMLLNYDCSNIPWSEANGHLPSVKYVTTYRRIAINDSGDFIDDKRPTVTYLVPEGASTLTLEVADTIDVTGFPTFPIPTVPKNGEFAGQVVCKYTEPASASTTGKESIILAKAIVPTIQQLENYALQAIYLFWMLLGILASASLMFIGAKYALSMGNTIRNEEVLTQAKYWLAGLVLAIVAIPFLYFVFGVINISTTECYQYKPEGDDGVIVYDLTVPGFTFFFADVCTGPYGVENKTGP